MRESFLKSLGFKIAVIVILSIGLIGGTSFFSIYYKQRSMFTEMAEEKVEALTSLVESALVKAMLSGRPEDVEGILVRLVEEQKDIREINIYSHQWKRTFSSDPAKRRTWIDRSRAEECLVCHALPPKERPRTVFLERDGEKILRGVRPITKREECKKCHPQEEKWRGMLVMDVSTRSLEDKLLSNMVWVFSGGAITFFALVAAIFLSINRTVTTPIGRIIETLKTIGSGRLTQRIDNPIAEREDSIGILARSINDMASSLQRMVSDVLLLTSKIDSASKEVVAHTAHLLEGAEDQKVAAIRTRDSIEKTRTSSLHISERVDQLSNLTEETSSALLEMTASIEEISESVHGVAKGVEDTTSSISEMLASIKEIAGSTQGLSASATQTAASMNEMAASIKEIENNAVNTFDLSQKASMEAEEGYKAVAETMKGIEETKMVIKSLSERLNKLGERSMEIGKILTIIDQIADQTNLLALNASIIAAQAGEGGKSFGVVASEIKKLSEETTASTREISSLIEAVQSETDEALKEMEAGEERMEKSMELALKANSTLKGILENAKRSAEMVQEIVRATKEQTKGTTYVTEAMEDVKDMIERIARATQEQSQGAEFIGRQIEIMKELTSQVKKATAEQSETSRQISRSMTAINERLKEINNDTTRQKEESERVMEAVEEIVSISERNTRNVKDIEETLHTLTQEVEDLKKGLGGFEL